MHLLNIERSASTLGEVFSTYLAPHIVKALPKEMNFTFTESLPGEIEEKIMKEEIHFGITYLPIPKPDLEHLLIKKIEMGVFGNPKAGFHRLPFEEWPFVIPLSAIETTPNRANGLDGWPDPLFRRSIRYQVSLMETAIALVRESLAVAYLPQFIVRLQNEIVVKELRLIELNCPKKFDQSQAVYLVKRRSEEESDTMKKVARVLRAL